jgi:hypothetical protein
MTALRSAAIASIALLSTGCMAHGPSFAETKPPRAGDGEAVLYVFRAYAEPTAWGATVSIDDQELTTLNQGGFTVAVVKPGTRNLKASWSGLSGQKDSTLALEIVAGQAYYVAVTGSVRMTGTSMRYGYLEYDWRLGSGMHPVKPSAAPAVLTECCKLQPSEPRTY